MAGLICTTKTAEIALVAATAKTVLQLKAPTNQRLKILSWGVAFDGVSSSAEPVVVELLRTTTDGTGSATPPTPTIVNAPGAGETVQATTFHNFTAEPSAGDILERREVHPQSGYEAILPFGQEAVVGGGGRIAIRCTAPAGVNVVAWFRHEE